MAGPISTRSWRKALRRTRLEARGLAEPVASSSSGLDDDEQSDDSDDEGEDESENQVHPIPTSSVSAPATPPTGTLVPSQPGAFGPTTTLEASGDEKMHHISIAVGSVVGSLAFVAIAFALWRWRKYIARRFKGRRRNDVESYDRDNYRAGPAMSEPAPTLFGGPSTEGRSHRQTQQFLQHPLPSAAAPSTLALERNANRRHLVRDSLLSEGDKRRVPKENKSFFLAETDDGLPGRSASQSGRKSPKSSLTIKVPPPPSRHLPAVEKKPVGIPTPMTREEFRFDPPPVPDSPEHAKNISRFSWTTTKSGQPEATEPPRFRTVDSWVSHQATQIQKQPMQNKRFTGMTGSTPSTPSAFRAHPGEAVKFVAPHNRMESKDLDLRLGLQP